MDVIGGMLADNTEIINNCIKGKEIISCIDNYNNISFEILNTEHVAFTPYGHFGDIDNLINIAKDI